VCLCLCVCVCMCVRVCVCVRVCDCVGVYDDKRRSGQTKYHKDDLLVTGDGSKFHFAISQSFGMPPNAIMWLYVCLCACLYMFAYVRTCARSNVCLHIVCAHYTSTLCVHHRETHTQTTHTDTDAYTVTHTHTHTRTHTHTHTRRHTHTHKHTRLHTC